MSSPTARTLKFERDRGNIAQVVEHWNPFARRRIDLFNCIDVIVLKEGRIYGVQCTSGSNHSARMNKAKETPAISSWIQHGGGFQVQSWQKKKNRWPKFPRLSEAVLGKPLAFYDVNLQ
jgi:hypothetical protein